MIVYIEDNLNNQRLMQRMMSKRNLEVAVFDNIEDGYQAIKERQPDLIFVDLHLKTRATGLDLVYRLRSEGNTTPIIIVTVFNMIADRKRALEVGCNDYLSKPYSMDELFEILDRHLGENVG